MDPNPIMEDDETDLDEILYWNDYPGKKAMSDPFNVATYALKIFTDPNHLNSTLDAIIRDDATYLVNELDLEVNLRFRPIYMEYDYALKWACYYGSLQCLEVLVAKPQFNFFGHYYVWKQTPLHFASQTPVNTRALQFLVSLARKQQIDLCKLLETVCFCGYTSLHLAALFGIPDTVSFLLDLGADPFKKNLLNQCAYEIADQVEKANSWPISSCTLMKKMLLCKKMKLLRKCRTRSKFRSTKLFWHFLTSTSPCKRKHAARKKVVGSKKTVRLYSA